MADPPADAGTADESPTVAFDAVRMTLPATPQELRRHLPGVEPERHVTDWGRSERIEAAVDRVVFDFLYHLWFRVEVEGIENVPVDGGALLVANHAGALPPDGVMLAKAVREAHPRGRAVHIALDRGLRGLPGIGSFVTKIGGVASHPANLHRLLFDERELVLAFPEGPRAAGKPLAERYRLRPFTQMTALTAALAAGVPIVPVALLGAEEAQPVFMRIPRLPLVRRLARLPRIPITAPIPLPAKFRVRFLDPVRPAAVAAGDLDTARAAALAGDVRALIQENLLEMVGARRSVWLG